MVMIRFISCCTSGVSRTKSHTVFCRRTFNAYGSSYVWTLSSIQQTNQGQQNVGHSTLPTSDIVTNVKHKRFYSYNAHFTVGPACLIKRHIFWPNTLLLMSKHLHFSSALFSHDAVAQQLEKPSLQLLHNVRDLMVIQIPTVLSERHEYRIYTKDVILENYWDADKPQRTIGIAAYVKAVLKARFYIHSRYAKTKITVVSTSIDEALGAVHINWHLSYLHQKLAFMFWKFAPFKFRSTGEALSDTIDGCSTFFVNNKGFVYKHVLTRAVTEELPDQKSN